MSLDDIADRILSNKRTSVDEVQSPIHPDTHFRYNSVNLLIGKRGCEKTYFIGRELLKLCYLPNCRYTQVYYVTDKARDDTFEFVQKCCSKIEIVWVKTSDAIKVIETLAKAKGCLSNREWCESNPEEALMYRKALNADSIDGIPHTLVIFDDSIGLFNKTTTLSKKLFENRQARITYFIALQDVQGLNPSMKANIDSIVLFGGFPKHKFSILTYQLPSIDQFDWFTYAALEKYDYMLVDFIDSTVQIQFRE